MNKTFLIVGKNFSGLRSHILSEGDDYVLLQDRLATKHPDKKFKRRIVADFSNKSKLFEAVEPLRGKINGVISVYESYILPTSWIANYLDLPGLPEEVATAVTDKYLMRQKFSMAAEHISPDFEKIINEGGLREFAAKHAFPLIIKPANLQKSLLVTKSHSLDELFENYSKSKVQLDKIYAKYSPHRKPQLVIEEFLEGPIYSVDAFVNGNGKAKILEQVVDYQTGYDIGFDDNFHYSRILPSKLSPEKIENIRRVAKLGCEALGLESTPAHIEIIYTKSGPMIVEIGARNGGYRERMHRLANGMDLVDLALKTSMGEPVDIWASKNEPVAVLELFPKSPGIFMGIVNEDKLKSLKSLNYFAIKQPLGKHVGKAADGYKMCAIIVLHNKNQRQFEKDLSFVNKSIHVITD